MKETRYNILYKGKIVYMDLSAEDCTEVLQDLSESFFSGELVDPEMIELQEI